MSFAEGLHRIMAEKRLTQKELAEMTNIPQPTISAYITGGRPGSTANILKLAKALDVSIDELLGREIYQDNKNDKQEEEILKIFRELNTNGQALLLQIGKALLFNPENTSVINSV